MNNSRRDQLIAKALASKTGECINWPFAVRKSSGYPAHSPIIDGCKKNVDAHRYVCELAHGAALGGRHAAHKCGNKLCINPRHVVWATPKENMDDAKRHGTLRGGGRYRQRFHQPEIEKICTSRESLIALAKAYDADPAYIGRLRRAHIHKFESRQ